MDRFTRRGALAAVGSAGALALSGCLGSDDDRDDENGERSSDGDDESVSYDVFDAGATTSRPPWAQANVDGAGYVALVESKRDAWMADDVDADGLEEWIDETDFDESVIVFVESAASNACYDAVEVGDVAIAGDGEDAAITGTAEAVDTSDGRDSCGLTLTYPSAFVRVTGDDLPSEAAFTITDGWGQTEEVDTIGGVVEPAELPGFVRPPHDPPTVPDGLVCDDDEFDRLESPVDEVAWGEIHDEDGEPTLAMRANDGQYTGGEEEERREFERGDRVYVELYNLAEDPIETGNRNKYSLEVLTDEGWTDVRGTVSDAPIAYTDEAVVHAPGGGFLWRLELTEDGVLEEHAHADRLDICPDLPPGRYRFAFWGTIGTEPLAVSFDYRG